MRSPRSIRSGRAQKERETVVNQLIAYLMENLILDFQGDLDLDMARGFLKDDDSDAAKKLHAKLLADGDVSDMLLVLADCLRDSIRTGVNEDVMLENLKTYADS